MLKRNNHIYQHILPFILIALLISGCKDGPFSTSENLVTVSGKVVYQNEGGDLIPVSNALIGTKEHRTSANSNSNGQFVLRDIKPGIVTFVVTHEDYFELEVPIGIKKSGNDSVDLIFPPELIAASMYGLVFDSRYPLRRHSEDYTYLIYTPVPGVKVFIDGEEKAFTDYQGRYFIDNLKSTVIDITYSKPNWETITVEVDPRKRSFDHDPYKHPLTPITEQYYAMSVGNYWEYSYRYIENKSEKYLGRITWRVTGEYFDEEEKWYELEEHALYDIFDRDSTYLGTHDEHYKLTVREIDGKWVFFAENGIAKYRFIKDVQIEQPDRFEEIIYGPYYPVGGTWRDRYVYERDVGPVEWDYSFREVEWEWRLIDFQTD